MMDIQKLDRKIQRGYLLILENHAAAGCDEWLESWEGIKQLMVETGTKYIYELDEKFSWSGPPSEYVEHMKAELHAEGTKNPVYQQKCIAYCQELSNYIGEDAQAARNMGYIAKKGFYYIDVTDKDLLNQGAKEPPPLATQIKTSRNGPCPCGSGKKYKKCCGAKMVV